MDSGFFWHRLRKPILGLSPMDGVTDAAFRYLTAKHGKPDVIFTEFVATEGLIRGIPKLFEDLKYHEIERPIVAQIFGSEPEIFYKVAQMVCKLGFDGVDINMGCPAKNIADRGCGAALILDPDRAKKIIRETKRGVEGKIPVSVKTRLGYEKVVITDWVQHLLEEEPAAISIHGRTLKQMYRGDADWEAIGMAAKIIKQTSTLVLGNGDISSRDDALEKIKITGVDGVLIGRAAVGNPWIFQSDVSVTPDQRLQTLLEHAERFEEYKGPRRFFEMNKHIKAYVRDFPEAGRLRESLYKTRSSEEMKAVMKGLS